MVFVILMGDGTAKRQVEGSGREQPIALIWPYQSVLIGLGIQLLQSQYDCDHV